MHECRLYSFGLQSLLNSSSCLHHKTESSNQTQCSTRCPNISLTKQLSLFAPLQQQFESSRYADLRSLFFVARIHFLFWPKFPPFNRLDTSSLFRSPARLEDRHASCWQTSPKTKRPRQVSSNPWMCETQLFCSQKTEATLCSIPVKKRTRTEWQRKGAQGSSLDCSTGGCSLSATNTALIRKILYNKSSEIGGRDRVRIISKETVTNCSWVSRILCRPNNRAVMSRIKGVSTANPFSRNTSQD